jgi:hypothetical protein
MEINLYNSHFPDGCPVVSGTKTKSYEPVSNYLVLNVHIPRTWAQGGILFFGLRSFFVLSADRRLVQICIHEFVLYE